MWSSDHVRCDRPSNQLCIEVCMYYSSCKAIRNPNKARTFSIWFNENEETSTHTHKQTTIEMKKNEDKRKKKTKQNKEQTGTTEKKLERTGHISLKFMRFKLMRINQNGIRLNFYLNYFAVHSFLCGWWRCYWCCCCCCCFCIFNEFIFGVSIIWHPKVSKFQKQKQRKRRRESERVRASGKMVSNWAKVRQIDVI